MAAKHSALDEASKKLSAAFTKLEAAVQYQADLPLDPLENQHKLLQSDYHALKQECKSLTEENALLSNQLQALQQDFVELQQLNEYVAGQIDRHAEQLEMLA